MDKIEITRDDFQRVIKEVMSEMVEDDNLEGMARVLIPLTGAVFAQKMEVKLFDNNSDTLEK